MGNEIAQWFGYLCGVVIIVAAAVYLFRYLREVWSQMNDSPKPDAQAQVVGLLELLLAAVRDTRMTLESPDSQMANWTRLIESGIRGLHNDRVIDNDDAIKTLREISAKIGEQTNQQAYQFTEASKDLDALVVPLKSLDDAFRMGVRDFFVQATSIERVSNERFGAAMTMLERIANAVAGSRPQVDILRLAPPLIERIDDLQLAVLKSNQQLLAGIDALVSSQQEFTRNHNKWMKAMFGGDASGYTDMTDEQAQLREEAEKLVRRYGCSWEEAVDRAKNVAAYKPVTGKGMGDNA